MEVCIMPRFASHHEVGSRVSEKSILREFQLTVWTSILVGESSKVRKHI